MERRLELQKILEDVLGSDKVYFQPPETIKLSYPCIIYELSSIRTNYANNSLYRYKKCYTVTVIDKNPDSDITLKLLRLPLCSFNRFYTADNLNHYSFTIYF